jgi:glycine/D-amino acid oxidase-like deaminating enzyme
MTEARDARRLEAARALAGARPVPFWLDQEGAPRPEAQPPLAGRTIAELAVIGGGFTGLWAALQAKEADPGCDVVLLEGRRVAWAGTGRNGGFCSASLTHGLANGHDRFPAELGVLERLGRDNLDGIEKTIARYQIDCDFVRSGELAVATEPWRHSRDRGVPVSAEAQPHRRQRICARRQELTDLMTVQVSGNQVSHPV